MDWRKVIEFVVGVNFGAFIAHLFFGSPYAALTHGCFMILGVAFLSFSDDEA
jgi:hypothetical protein